MPHFDEFGGDSWICQICAQTQNSRAPYAWRPDITGNKSAGAVCAACIRLHGETGFTGDLLRTAEATRHKGPISLAEHCRQESGGLTGRALDRYINRYYGHG